MNVSTFIDKAKKWAEEQPNIRGLALVGSYAKGSYREDSDIDLVAICADSKTLLEKRDWINSFGEPIDVLSEDYGAVQSVRIFYRHGLEIEMGITSLSWTDIPLDSGTRQVIQDGIKVIHDPDKLLNNAINAAAAQ